MRRPWVFGYVALMLILVCGCDKNIDDTIVYEDGIDFPEPPIQIMSNVDDTNTENDCVLLNYFNIIKAGENQYYMYYAALGRHSGKADIDQGLYFTYSNDGFTWQHKLPNGRSNQIVASGIQEQSVFKMKSDKETPYRLIANIMEDGKHKLCMWKSKNGYEFDFENKKVLLDDRLHDTQNVMIERGNVLRLYTRLWGDKAKNRRNGVCDFDLAGNLLTPIDTLEGDYVYNSAASYLNEQYDMLIPTYMNNADGDNKSDNAYFVAYLNHEGDAISYPINLNKWIKDDEKWVIAAPGIIQIGEDYYIAYNTRNWSHDTRMPEGGVSRYYLIKVRVFKDGRQIL